jgi:6-phosphofructokinase 1
MTRDKFNIEFGAMGGTSVAVNLHKIISEEFGLRGEFQITESLIMCDFVRASEVDLEEAFQCGAEAVKLALKGETGVMVTINRLSDDPYMIEFGKVPLHEVAVAAKPMLQSTQQRRKYVSDSFIKYMKPLEVKFLNLSGLKKYSQNNKIKWQ